MKTKLLTRALLSAAVLLSVAAPGVQAQTAYKPEYRLSTNVNNAFPLGRGAEEWARLVKERTEDLQRVQAEYVNYKRRVDRDRGLARQAGIEAVLRDLMPVFDSIIAAQEHDDLSGGFKLTADELTKVAKSYGFEPFGIPGDEFDPRLHEALMQMPDPEATEMVVRDVMQQGYRINDLVVRPARVIVSVPAE